ncbi:Annexin D3 [Acorus calamus]|uniref:Annexin n=1 Tax=Acorus calamus TaxID=4465 RepID=A0AAV9CSM8_ACOCL|nr:Annexin D3 [Acorus calamus]
MLKHKKNHQEQKKHMQPKPHKTKRFQSLLQTLLCYRDMSTIRVPETEPSAVEDCRKLKKAFKGWGTDERAAIRILGCRNAKQRSTISRTYQQLYTESLIEALESELSGDFGKAMILLAMEPSERDAKLAREAVKRYGEDRYACVLVEVACASSAEHLVAVRRCYCSLFGASIEEDVGYQFCKQQPLAMLLMSLVSSYRYENGECVDDELAKSEAAALRGAIVNKQVEQDGVTQIVATRNKDQLKATFRHYKQAYGTNFDEDIRSCGGNKRYTTLLQEAIWCLETPEKHFAKVIRDSVVGLGTDEDSLTRAIVTRADIDMVKIKEEYIRAYKTTVEDDVIGDTSGYYKEILLTLLGSDNM